MRHDDVKLLGLFTHGPGHIHNSKRTVNSAEDMKGLKLRVGGGVASVILLLHLVQWQFRSRLQVAMSLFPVVWQMEHYSRTNRFVAFKYSGQKLLTPTLVPGGTHNFSFYLAMNKDRFEALPEEDQKAIESVSGEAFCSLGWEHVGHSGCPKVLEAMKANGNEIVTAGESFLTEIGNASAPMEAEWLETAAEMGVDGKAALEAFRSLSHQK